MSIFDILIVNVFLFLFKNQTIVLYFVKSIEMEKNHFSPETIIK